MSTNRSTTRNGRNRTTDSKNDRRQRDSVMTSKQKEDDVLEAKISQVVQLTGCTKDEAFVALYDCEDDAERAVDMLLESDDQGTWVKSTKKKRPPKPPASAETKTTADEAGRAEEGTTSSSSRAGGGGSERGRSRTRGAGRGRQSGEDGGWKARERRENEKNTWVGRGSGRGGRGGRRGGPMPRVFRQRGGGAGGGASAEHADDWCSGSLAAWNSGSGSDAWNQGSGSDAWNQGSSSDAWNSDAVDSWTRGAENSTEDWNGVEKEVPLTEEADEWCGPLTETKVFTPSGADPALLLNCSPELQLASSASANNTDTPPLPDTALDGGEAAPDLTEPSVLQQSHHTNSADYPASTDLSDRMPVVLTTPSTVCQSAASKLRTKKTRTHGSVKIPESAVEMPSDSVANLGVNFGVALNFNATVDFSDSVSSPTLPATPSASLPSATNTPAATGQTFSSQQQQQHPSGSPAQGLLSSNAGPATSPASIYSSKVGVSATLGSTRVAALSSGQSVAPGFSSSVCPPSVHAAAGSSPANGSVLQPSSSSSAPTPFPDVSSAASSVSSAAASLGGPGSAPFSAQSVATSTGAPYQLTADSTPAGSGAYGSGASQAAPGFGGYVNGGQASGSAGPSSGGSGYLGSAGVSIKDKLTSALAGGGHSVKQNHLDPMSSVSGSVTAPSAGASINSSSGAIASSAPGASTSNGSMAHKLSGTRAGAAGLPGLPPGVPMQYFMGQAGVPAFYPGVQQIYGYEDLHALQQRMPHLTTSVEQSARVDTSTLSTTVAAGAYSDVGKFNRQDNSSPVHSSLSQQSHSQQQQQQQQQFYGPTAIPPNYYYPYLSPYGIYAPLPQATSAVPPHQATTQYQKLSTPAGSYNSPGYGGYDSLVSSTTGAPSDYKSPFVAAATGGSSSTGPGSSSSGSGGVAGSSGVSLGSSSAHKSSSGAGSVSSASDVYGKLPQLGKSFDNKGFHAATPPPFGMSGGAGGAGAPLAAAAGSAYAPHHMYLQPMAPQHPSQLLGHHHGHHPGHHQQDGSGHGPQQRQAPTPVAAATAKSAKPTGYSTGYWSSN